MTSSSEEIDKGYVSALFGSSTFRHGLHQQTLVFYSVFVFGTRLYFVRPSELKDELLVILDTNIFVLL